MRQICVSKDVKYPDSVVIKVNKRDITVKGRRGVLKRSFAHSTIEILHDPVKRTVTIRRWFGDKKQIASIRSICSHIDNMVTGVMKGYKYVMKTAYAHFPINCNIQDEGKLIEIRNFLGERIIRRVPMKEGVEVVKSPNKDEYIVQGNNLEVVSQCAARIHQSCLVKNKDIRKFLDGIYVLNKTHIDMD